MDQVDGKQVAGLLRSFGDAMVKGKSVDGCSVVEDVLGEGIISASVADEIAGTMQIAMETIVNADYSEDDLVDYLQAQPWARDEKEVIRAFTKWWRKERDAVLFARLRQSSIKPLLEDFKWNIVAHTTSTGTTENHCRVSLTIRQQSGEAKELTFSADADALQHLVDEVTKIESSISGAAGDP
ncbi:hypothetical protein DIPPA_18031 [Diplonema papillatum]|nr:hypothetical protein DIPPA_18031 [Diplonema papillatum]